MSNIIVLAGKKQSGKSSSAKFLTGYILRQLNISNPEAGLKYFEVNDKGELLVNTRFINSSGNEEEGTGILDIYRRDENFVRYALNNIWPFVKVYSFAERLKQTLEIVFGIPHEALYGTDEQKNAPSHLKWEDMPFPIEKTGYMTYRQVAQFFGSEICRKMMDSCWVQACYSDILNDDSQIAIIDDARFPNEVTFMKDKGAKVIKLSRTISGDNHQSETALDNLDPSLFDAVINNQNMTMKEKNDAVLEEILRLGLFEVYL